MVIELGPMQCKALRFSVLRLLMADRVDAGHGQFDESQSAIAWHSQLRQKIPRFYFVGAFHK
jgi:hypothetical protein